MAPHGKECWRRRTLFLFLGFIGVGLLIVEFVDVLHDGVGDNFSSVTTMQASYPTPFVLAVNNTPPKDGASTLTQLEDVAGFGMIQNLYYHKGAFHLFFHGTEKERYLFTRQIETRLCGGCTNKFHKDFPMHIHDYADLPGQIDHVWPGITWVLLSSPVSTDHYFHFLEYLVGMWPIAYFMDSIDPVQNVVIGPFVDDAWMVKDKKIGLNDLILGALFPNAKRWFGSGEHALPVDDVWIRMDRAITGERSAVATNPINKRQNNLLPVAMTKWALQHDPMVYDHMKKRILSNLCNGDMCGYHQKPPLTSITTRNIGGDLQQLEVRRPRLTYVSHKHRDRKFEDQVSLNLDAMLVSNELATYFQVQIVHMQNYSALEQIRIAANTDIMLGIHGNGLTHAFWMPMHGAVIEVLQKSNCLYDYQWIAAASGQHWIGLTQEGIRADRSLGGSYCNARRRRTGMDSITIDLEHLKTTLLTLRNVLNGEPLA